MVTARRVAPRAAGRCPATERSKAPQATGQSPVTSPSKARLAARSQRLLATARDYVSRAVGLYPTTPATIDGEVRGGREELFTPTATGKLWTFSSSTVRRSSVDTTPCNCRITILPFPASNRDRLRRLSACIRVGSRPTSTLEC